MSTCLSKQSRSGQQSNKNFKAKAVVRLYEKSVSRPVETVQSVTTNVVPLPSEQKVMKKNQIDAEFIRDEAKAQVLLLVAQNNKLVHQIGEVHIHATTIGKSLPKHCS